MNKKVKEGDFIYLDPPYVPENSYSFTEYVKEGFDLNTHKLLFLEIKKLENIKFLMSNSKVNFVINNCKEYNCNDIITRRSIHSKNPGSKTTEVFIYN